MQKIIPFLWFNDNAEDAVNFYTSIFKDAKVTGMNRSGEVLPGEKGKLFTATFQLAGQGFYALNGGPMFSFTPAVSLFVNCETEQEIDELWKKLSQEGKILMELSKYPFSEKFGWVQDKFGLSWQLNLTHTSQKVTPFLMFVKEQNGKAEEAIHFYNSVFQHSDIVGIARYGPGQGGEEGTIVHAEFTLDGQSFMAMDSNGDHAFSFTPALSFFVNCTTQEEVDYFWEKLSEGGGKDRCGWIWDKYGVSWQIVPTILGELLYHSDPLRAKRVMQAMLKMTKLNIKELQEA